MWCVLATLEDVLFLDFHAEGLDDHLHVPGVDLGVGLLHHGVEALHDLHERFGGGDLRESIVCAMGVLTGTAGQTSARRGAGTS